MLEPNDLPLRLAVLERTVRRQRLALGALALVLGVVALASWTRADPIVVRATRFEVVDGDGTSVGAFGIGAIGPELGLVPSPGRRIGWVLRDSQSDTFGFFLLRDSEDEGEGASKGEAILQLEAGSTISQLYVSRPKETAALSFIAGEDESPRASLAAGPLNSHLRLAPDLQAMTGSGSLDRSLMLQYGASGPSITGVAPDGASRIELP